MSDFNISARCLANHVVLDLEGDVETFAITKIRAELEKQINDKQYNILLNLKKVSRFNSTALGILIGRLRKFRISGGDICMCNLNNQTRKMFDLMGVSRVFEIYSSEEEALKTMNN